MEELTEEERKALRLSKFAPLPSSSSAPTSRYPSSSSAPTTRKAHPGGALKTNKAAALAKFLERKLQDPDGLSSINLQLLQVAVQNAKQTVQLSGTANSGRIVQHVDSFGDSEPEDSVEVENSESKKQQKKRKKKKMNDKKKKKKLKTF